MQENDLASNGGRGFFMKPLSNSQTENFDASLIYAIFSLTEALSREFHANIALVISLDENAALS